MPGENPTATTTSAAPVVAPQQTPVASQQPAAPQAQQTEATPATAKPGAPVAQEPPKAADPAPQDAELKLPEGVKVDTQFLEAAKAAFKAQSMTSAQAQAVVDAYAANVAAQNKAFEEQQTKQREEWRAAIKGDPAIGGAKFEASQATVAKAVDKFFGEEGRKLFDLTGFGDHPVIFRALHQIGTRISEDSVAGTVSDAPHQVTLANFYDHPTSRKFLK